MRSYLELLALEGRSKAVFKWLSVCPLDVDLLLTISVMLQGTSFFSSPLPTASLVETLYFDS
jgi:hypothetical protein